MQGALRRGWRTTYFLGVLMPWWGTVASAAPELVVSPSALDFGAYVETTPWRDAIVEVRNPGTSPLQLDDLEISGPGAGSFVLWAVDASCDGSQHCPVTRTIEPGGLWFFNVLTVMQPPGEHHATLVVSSNAGVVTVPISGTAFDQPQIEVTPASLVFPPARRCTGSSQLSFTIRNSGPPSAAPLQYSFVFPGDSHWGIWAPQCPMNLCAGSIAAGELATFDATFVDSCSDGASTWMPIAVNLPDSAPVAVPVRTQVSEGYLTIDDVFFQLGDGPVGVPFPAVTVHGHNGSSVPVTVRAVQGISDTGATFVITGGPPGGLVAPGEATTWTVQVTPGSHGEDSFARVHIDTNGEWSQLDVGFAFRGWGEGVVAFPDQLDFGTVRIGTSARRSYQLRNTGAQPHLLAEIENWQDSSVYAVAVRDTTLPHLLAPGEEVTVDVTYTPMLPQQDAFNAYNQIETWNAGWDTWIGGAGVIDGVPAPSVEITPLSLDLGDVPVGSAVRLSELVPGGVLLHNLETAAIVRLRDVALSGSPDFQLQPPDRASLLPGDTARLDVVLTPTTPGELHATIEIYLDDEGPARARIELRAHARLTTDPAPPRGPSGCAAAPNAAAWWLLLALGLAGWRRRRRASEGRS